MRETCDIPCVKRAKRPRNVRENVAKCPAKRWLASHASRPCIYIYIKHRYSVNEPTGDTNRRDGRHNFTTVKPPQSTQGDTAHDTCISHAQRSAPTPPSTNGSIEKARHNRRQAHITLAQVSEQDSLILQLSYGDETRARRTRTKTTDSLILFVTAGNEHAFLSAAEATRIR